MGGRQDGAGAGGVGGAGEGEGHGYTPEEVWEAVETARSSDDVGALHEAVAVMRDVSASGFEACRDLIKYNGVQVRRVLGNTVQHCVHNVLLACM